MKILLLLLLLLILWLVCRSRYSSFTSSKERLHQLYTTFSPRFNLKTKNKKLDNVDMIYTITMPQRKEYISKQMDTLGFTFTCFDAMKPDDLSDSDYNLLSTTNDPTCNYYQKKTRLPVTLSFIMCFMDAIQKGYTTIIIFEDDIIINVDTSTLNNSLTEFYNSDLDIFYMGYCFLNCNQKYDKNKYTHLYELVDRRLVCGHAVCFKVNVLQKLIDHCFNPRMYKPSDEMFYEFYVKNFIKICVPKFAYFDQVERDKMDSLNDSTVKLEHCQ